MPVTRADNAMAEDVRSRSAMNDGATYFRGQDPRPIALI